jgi:hypothetical protein
LLIRRLLIFDSSVVRGIPSFPAAPDDPEIRPRLSPEPLRIISLSRFARSPQEQWAPSVPRGSGRSHVSSIENVSAITQDYGPLHYVLQLANVAWPIVGLQPLQSSPVDVSDLLPGLIRVTLDEIRGQQGNIFRALAQ